MKKKDKYLPFLCSRNLLTQNYANPSMWLIDFWKIGSGLVGWALALFLAYSYFRALLSLAILINFILIKKKRCNALKYHSYLSAIASSEEQNELQHNGDPPREHCCPAMKLHVADGHHGNLWLRFLSDMSPPSWTCHLVIHDVQDKSKWENKRKNWLFNFGSPNSVTSFPTPCLVFLFFFSVGFAGSPFMDAL